MFMSNRTYVGVQHADGTITARQVATGWALGRLPYALATIADETFHGDLAAMTEAILAREWSFIGPAADLAAQDADHRNYLGDDYDPDTDALVTVAGVGVVLTNEDDLADAEPFDRVPLLEISSHTLLLLIDADTGQLLVAVGGQPVERRFAPAVSLAGPPAR